MDAQYERDWFIQHLNNRPLVQKLKKVKLIVCDVDGSLTDGHIYTTHENEEGRHFSLLDGYGIIMAMRQGLMISLMSGKEHNSLLVRGSALQIPHDLCFQKCIEKPQAINSLMKTYNLDLHQVVMFGDDLIDWQVKEAMSDMLFVVPQNTPFYIQSDADIIIPRHGGHHALRLFIDFLLYIQNKHYAQSLIAKSLGTENIKEHTRQSDVVSDYGSTK